MLFLAATFLLSQASAFSFCKSSLLVNKGLQCSDGSKPTETGCCNPTTCQGMDCCPKNCRGLSYSGSGAGMTCTCSGCEDTEEPVAGLTALSEGERWTKAHNYFRCRHGQTALDWDTTTYDYAKSWADQCTYQHSGPADWDNGGAGENLATSSNVQDFPPESSTERWYSEVNTAAGGQGYIPRTASNDARYGASGGANQVGHYTAMIWKDTTKLGCAICPGNGGSQWEIDVCQYADKTPNMLGGEDGVQYYVENVPQSNTPVASESECCNEVYGNLAGWNPVPGGNGAALTATASLTALLALSTSTFLTLR